LEPTSTRNPLFSFFIVICFAFVGLLIGNFAGLIGVLPFFDYNLSAVEGFLSNPISDESGRTPLLIVQGITSFFAFIIAPLLYIRYFERKRTEKYLFVADPILPAIILTVIIGQTFMFLNTPVIEWNMGLQFPEFLSEFEAYAQQQEEFLKEVTEFVTVFDTPGQFILGMVVIAIIPGIGEELLFRGLIQEKLSLLMKNPHIAIWVTGFLFGLFHFQFYGLFPRMLLGVLFGYLYWWSGSLLLAMIAHFFNNGFTILMVYLYQGEMINFDIEGTSEIPTQTVLISGILFTTVFYYFFKIVKHRRFANE